MSSKCYWVTGLSEIGKSTYSNMLAQHLRAAGKKVILLDGDPKGLDKKQVSGEMKNFAGIDLQVDYPKNPHVYIKWEKSKVY